MPAPTPRLLLASASPRRYELLSCLGVGFDVVAADVDETFIPGTLPAAEARRLARDKGGAIATRHPEAFVLAADTIVVHRGAMLAKPADAAEALRMLQGLRARIHRVITGVALLSPGRKRPRVFHAVTRVHMRAYSDADIEDTIGRGVPFDKAGGYGIQDPVLRPVEACDGCFCNVMGLPLWRTAHLLQEAGLEVDPRGLPERCLTCPDRPPG